MTATEREYLEIVKRLVKNNRGQIDGERPYLDGLRDRLRLSPEQTERIEQRVLSAYQTFLSRSQDQGTHSAPTVIPPDDGPLDQEHHSLEPLPSESLSTSPSDSLSERFTNPDTLEELDELNELDKQDEQDEQFTPTYLSSSDPSSSELPATELAPTALQPPISSDSSQLAVSVLPELSELERALQKRQWKDADQITLELMLKLTGYEAKGWLDAEAMSKLPCTQLEHIDRLWRRYSNGKFGFGPQGQVFSELERSLSNSRLNSQSSSSSRPNQQPLFHSSSAQAADLDYQAMLAFCKKIGWWQSGAEFHKYYNQLNLNPNANSRAETPRGHLPALWYWQIPWWRALQFGGIGPNRGGCCVDVQTLAAFIKQLQTCKFSPKEPLSQTEPLPNTEPANNGNSASKRSSQN